MWWFWCARCHSLKQRIKIRGLRDGDAAASAEVGAKATGTNMVPVWARLPCVVPSRQTRPVPHWTRWSDLSGESYLRGATMGKLPPGSPETLDIVERNPVSVKVICNPAPAPGTVLAQLASKARS